jgi:hypothetical protein
VTSGKTDRSDRWSWSGRAEYRGRDRSTRQGLLMSELRQPGEGQAVGGTFRGARGQGKSREQDRDDRAGAQLGASAA